MMMEDYQLPWTQPGWDDEASAWIHAQLEAQGIQVTGEIEILHRRAWSAFARVPTSRGTIYYKAPAPALKFEAALTQALAHWRPDCMLPLLAANFEQGWMLTPDSGVALVNLIQSPADISHWLKVIPLFAGVQIELAAHLAEILATGAPDRRLACLPDQYAQLLEDTGNLRVGLPQGLSPEEHRRLLDLRPCVAELCEQLAGYGLPETIVHEEIHRSNVIFGPAGYIFTDWSDCSVGHPFITLLVTLRSVAHWQELDEDGPELTHLRDIYLQAWTAFAPRQDLLAAFQIAYRLGMIVRALAYHQVLGPLPEQYKVENDAIPGWLQDFLEAETKAGV